MATEQESTLEPPTSPKGEPPFFMVPAGSASTPLRSSSASLPHQDPMLAESSSKSAAHASAWVTLLCFLLALIGARVVVPQLVEEMRYSWHRGELRAEYETSGEGLRNVSLESLSQAYQMVSDRVGPSVAHIDVMRTTTLVKNDTMQRMKGSASTFPSDQGSGIIVSSDGYILTNQHVIEDSETIRVALGDGRRVIATLVGSDPLTDLALLKVPVQGLIPVEWGDSDTARVGTPVWAMGSPFGLERTVTFGILSGVHRAAKAGTRYQDFMQSDVAVNPGNSGGPLVDSRGMLIGVNTAIVGDTYRGVSFSIPSNVAKQVFERLKSSGSVERGWLGVALADQEDGLGQPISGAVVTGLAAKDSPAADAGIRPGDLIRTIDGQEIRDMGDLMRRIANVTIGTTVTLSIVREEQLLEIPVKIGVRPLL